MSDQMGQIEQEECPKCETGKKCGMRVITHGADPDFWVGYKCDYCGYVMGEYGDSEFIPKELRTPK